MSSRAMLKTLLFSLAGSFLVLLGTAAPVDENQRPSHPIQARQLTCHAYFGMGIEASDCAWALEAMGRMPNTRIDPATGDTVITHGVFGRDASDARFRMPQRFAVGTCAIIVDMTNPEKSMVSTWDFAGFGAHDLATNCALRNGWGGLDNRYGFDTVLINPSTMSGETRALWDRCSLLIDDHNQPSNPVAMTPCITPDPDSAEASMRAGFGRSGSTETE